ncbi:MAG TPA: hypothetical protein VN696_08925 [Pyrinomonadaceae bacterium]|nr:hypothetical protein [Pyrinomonadaceae bacterium]
MKLCISIIVGVVCALLTSNSVFAQCGVERWAVKTGTDADAGLVNLNSTSATTIANLTSLARPSSLPDNGRIAPTERTVWVINATLREYVRAYDSDYHMVLTDNAGRTMIAEIPAPNCVGASSPFAAGIASARAQFEAVFTPQTYLQSANIPVQITGVGFFDYLEGQQGVAPNAIELHPIIDIQFGPFFMLTAAPSSMAIPQGSSGSTTISSTLSGNFNSSIAFSVSGLPAGATATIVPPSLGPPGQGSTTLTISVPSTTPLGTYNVVVNGTGAGQTRTTTINFTVTISGSAQQLLGNPGFENGANPTPWTASAGVMDNSSLLPAHSGSWKAWLNGYGTPHTDTLAQTVTIPSTTTQASLAFWLHIETTEVTTTTTYDTLKVQLRNSSGAVLKTLATYSNVDAIAGYQQFSFDLTSYKGQTVQIYLVGVEDAGAKTGFLVDDFAVYALPGSGGGTGGTTQMFGNPGFENGLSNPSPWIATGGVIDNDPSEPSHSGSWKGWLNGWGVAHTDSAAQSVTIPANATLVRLTFWLHIATAESTKTKIYDSLAVQIRSSSGAVLATLASYSNLNAAPGYSQVSFDLTSYKGQTIQVYLLGVEDDGLKTSFLVDDFTMNVTTP